MLQRHSSADTKSSGNSNTSTPTPLSMYICGYPLDRAAFKEHLSAKEACIFLIMKRLSVIHAALGITVTTLRGNGALFQYDLPLDVIGAQFCSLGLYVKLFLS